MAERLLYCRLCDIHLNGPSTALQHYNGSKHMKKEAASMCHLSKDVTSTVYQNAMESRVVPQSFPVETAQVDFVMVKAKDPRLPPVRVPVTGVTLPTKEYELFGSSGMCYICSVELSSRENADQHLSGQKHVKAKKQWEAKRAMAENEQQSRPVAVCRPQSYSTLNNDSLDFQLEKRDRSTLGCLKNKVSQPQLLYCDVCNKYTNTEEQLELHKRSPAHLKKAERAAVVVSLQPTPRVSATQYKCPLCHECFQLPEQLGLHVASCHSNSSFSKLEVKSDVVTELSDGASLSGNLANTTDQLMRAQLHNATETEPSSGTVPKVYRNPADNTTWYLCEPCGKKVNTLQQLSIHEQSPAHLKKARQFSTTASAPCAGMSQISADRTVWYTCPVCCKSVNSKQQLHIHVQSHGQSVDQTEMIIRKNFAEKSFPEHSNVWNIASSGPEKLSDENQSSAGSMETKESVYQESNNSRENAEEPMCIGSNSSEQLTDVHNECGNVKGSEFSMLGLSLELSAVAAEMEIESERTDGLVDLNDVTTSADCSDRILPDRDDNNFVSQWQCSAPGCIYHCVLCDKHLNSEDSKDMHLNGKPHADQFSKAVQLSDPVSHDSTPFGAHYRYFCTLCEVPFYTMKDKSQHEKGQLHRSKMIKKNPAPNRDLPDVKMKDEVDENHFSVESLTQSIPREYQVELFRKALTSDCVCFLPTGTGKTLVAVMLMSRLLALNPRHSVLFLVDKILLTLQQTRFIKQELGNKTFERWNETLQSMEKRRLRIAMLCGQKTDLGGAQLWEQDVIVATAAYYFNLLECGALRWSDNCLVIFDEVHHCLKDHPYHQVVQKTQHWNLEPERRPRIFGLTASPAGCNTTTATATRLHELLANVQVERLIAVEEHLSELAKYRSNTQLTICEVFSSTGETELSHELRQYISSCYSCLMEKCDVDSLPEYLSLLTLNGDRVGDGLALDSDIICGINETIDEVRPKETSDKMVVSFLSIHIRVLGQALNLLESIGLDFAYDELRMLAESDYVGSFLRAHEIKLSCEKLQAMVTAYIQSHSASINLQGEPKPCKLESFEKLVTELVQWWDGHTVDEVHKQQDTPIALILVRERSTAFKVKKELDVTKEICDRQIRVGHVVGHGRSSSEDKCGMNIKQQSHVIKNICGGEYNVVIATAIAEEGIDMPDCDLVIQLDTPNCVRALVQVRGRARRRGGKFLAFCRDKVQCDTLKNLLQQEENMMAVVNDFIR